MLDRALWKAHPEPVFTTSNGVLEDFVVVENYGELAAYYCSGPNLQDQRIYVRPAKTPLGPFGPVKAIYPDGTRGHTRLYRGKVTEDVNLISAVWPGLPRCGIWVFRDEGPFLSKELLIAPKEGTLYSIAACNPCVVFDEAREEFDIFFEGRDETVFWRIFQATWDGESAVATVIDEPVCDGANPSILVLDDVVYLYYSRWNAEKGGFDTHVLTQPV